MIEKMVLETDAFRFTFDVGKHTRDPEGWIGMDISIEFSNPPLDLTLHSERTSITSVDLQGFHTYLAQHREKVKADGWNAESDVFITMELGFQFQALIGDAEPPDDGHFGVRCQVNVGKTSSGSRVYVGGESSVTFQQIEAFMQNIQEFLDELQHLPVT